MVTKHSEALKLMEKVSEAQFYFHILSNVVFLRFTVANLLQIVKQNEDFVGSGQLPPLSPFCYVSGCMCGSLKNRFEVFMFILVSAFKIDTSHVSIIFHSIHTAVINPTILL